MPPSVKKKVKFPLGGKERMILTRGSMQHMPRSQSGCCSLCGGEAIRTTCAGMQQAKQNEI